MYSILHTIVELLEMPINEYVYISQIYFYVIPIFGLPTAWFVDRFGFKKSILLCLFLSNIRNALRALTFAPNLPYYKDMRVFYWFTNNMLLQQVVCIYYCLPLKISECWFSSSERSIAWSLMIVTPILGAACSALTVPRFVHGPHSTQILVYINIISAIISTIVILLSVTRSKPKYPPSLRAKLNETFSSDSTENNQTNNDELDDDDGNKISKPKHNLVITNLKHLFTDKNVVVLIIAIASFDAFVVTINSILQDVLSASGFTSLNTGQFIAIMFLASALLQTLGSFLVKPSKNDDDGIDEDKKQQQQEFQNDEELLAKNEYKKKVRNCKLYMSISCLTFVSYCLTLSLRDYPDQQWWLAIVASLIYTLIRFWAMPSYIDLLAHLISGSISQPIAGAFQMTAQALLTVLFSVVFVYLRRVDKPPEAINGNGQEAFNETSIYDLDNNLNDDDVILKLGRPNYFWSIIFLASACIIIVSIYVIVFDGKKRKYQSSSETMMRKGTKESGLKEKDKRMGLGPTRRTRVVVSRCYSTASLPLDLTVVGGLTGNKRRISQQQRPIGIVA